MIKIDENVLSNDLSPYLKQHKDNPVNWQIWSKETLEFTKKIKKPILLSIGYASCHWCHVMAHESFEDIETAKIMNELFVNIKVDREERPDLDFIFQSSFQLFNQTGGGWPLTMFLDENGVPFGLQNLIPILFGMGKMNYFLSSFFGFIPSFFIFNTIGAGLNSYIEQSENFKMLDFILTPEIYSPILMFACLMIISLIIKKYFFNDKN